MQARRAAGDGLSPLLALRGWLCPAAASGGIEEPPRPANEQEAQAASGSES